MELVDFAAAGASTGTPHQRLTQQDAHRLMQGHAKKAGIKTSIGNHTMRATSITDYLRSEGSLSEARKWLTMPIRVPLSSTTSAGIPRPLRNMARWEFERMSSLTNFEKRKLENFLEMKGGWVLNFSDRTFAQFVTDSTGLNIFDARYHYASGSKANKLRAFWAVEDDQVVGKLMSDMLDYACEGVRTGELAAQCRQIVARLQGIPVSQPRTAEVPVEPKTLDPKQHERLAAALNGVMQLAPSPRGFAFEKFLDEAFAAFNLAPRKSFRLVGEQIDGSFHLASETYLVEAKWQNQQIGNRELQAFAGSVRTKEAWSRGLYISYSGFTSDGLAAFGRGDATRIICLDGLELWQIVNKGLNLADVLALKTRRAAETGRAYVPIQDLF